MIYTPPQYSDHIAVTLLLRQGVEGTGEDASFECARICGIILRSRWPLDQVLEAQVREFPVRLHDLVETNRNHPAALCQVFQA